MSTLRWILVAALLAAGAWGAYALWGPRPALPPPSRSWRNEACRECHPQVYAEWERSWHRHAYVDPLFKKLSQNYADTSCFDCHLPRPLPEVGLENRPLPRLSRKEAGIDCLTCHFDGRRVVGVRERPAAGCRPRGEPKLATELACKGCHDQHKLHEEWRRTPFFARGVDCIDCHMPAVTRRGPEGRSRPGRHHGFISSRWRDPRWLPTAVDVTVRGPADPGGRPGFLEVAVTNRRAGHNFPSDSRYKAADLVTRFYTASGHPLGEAVRERFHNPLRDALDQRNTQIPYGETRRFRYRLPGGAAYAEVRLLYRILKTDPDRDAHVLFRRVVRW